MSDSNSNLEAIAAPGMKPNGCGCAPTSERAANAKASSENKHASRELREGVMGRMIALPGGTFLMGTENPDGFPQDGEGSVRAVTLEQKPNFRDVLEMVRGGFFLRKKPLDGSSSPYTNSAFALGPFSIDRYPVTNDLFARFVEATGYRTDAERFGWSFVFWAHLLKARLQELVEDTVAAAPRWCKVRDARWNAPEGPGSNLATRGDHPVVHVSWDDAKAFCGWSGQRLLTVAEWEYAARGGLEQKLYPCGDKLRPGGEHLCNIWQGEFPRVDTAEDGYAGTCPVDAFPANGFDLYSMTGNTWEWCKDWFDAEFHRTADRTNPNGPPEGTARVMKGGSFLCHKSYCNRYRVAARSSIRPIARPQTSAFAAPSDRRRSVLAG